MLRPKSPGGPAIFTISPETFARMESASEAEFVRRLGSTLREAVPALASEPPEPFAAQVRLQIEAARGWGLTSEQAIGGYAVTAALLGPDFPDRFPGAREILAGGESGDRKAELLEAFTLNLLDTLES